MTKKKKIDIIEIIIQIIFVILATIFIIQILLKLFGNSPTELQLLYVGFGSIFGYLFFITYKLGEISQNVKINNKELKEIKYRLSQVDNRLIKIESKI